MQRDEGALLRGAALAVAQERLKQRREDLGKGELEFIQASIEVRNQEQKKRERKRQLTISKLVGSLILALGLSAFAGWQWRFYERTLIKQSDALNTASEALLTSNKEFDALIASLKGARNLNKKINSSILHLEKPSDINEKVSSLLQEALYKIREQNRLEEGNDWASSVAFSPDGKTIASTNHTTIKLWRRDGKLLKNIPGNNEFFKSVAYFCV